MFEPIKPSPPVMSTRLPANDCDWSIASTWIELFVTHALRKQGIRCVALSDYRDRERPVDPQHRIIPTQPAGTFRMIRLGDLIKNLCALSQCLIAVREPFGYVEHAMIG